MNNNNDAPLRLKTTGKRAQDNELCPCGKSNADNKFCSFENYEGQGKGFCHSCGETFLPDGKQAINNAPAFVEAAKKRPTQQEADYLKNFGSNLHSFMRGFADQDLQAHFAKYLIGTHKGKTVFGYADSSHELLSLKFILYQKDGKRDRQHNPYYTKDCARCLYGLHLYDRRKPAIVVESEKTAQALGLYFDSQYNFLATGGANGVKKERLLPLIGNEVYYFADNDEAGQNNKVIAHLRTLHEEGALRLKVLMPFSTKPPKYDVGDYLFEHGKDDTGAM